MKNKAAYMVGLDKMELRDVPVPELKRGEVLVRLEYVGICGSGCIGLMTLLACKACGAADITVVDVIPKRLEYAMKLGVTRVINGKENVVKAVIKMS